MPVMIARAIAAAQFVEVIASNAGVEEVGDPERSIAGGWTRA